MQAIIRQVAQMTAGVAGVRDQDLVVDPILKSDFQSRGDYGDVERASDFQSSFIGTFNRYFGSNDQQNYTNYATNKTLWKNFRDLFS